MKRFLAATFASLSCMAVCSNSFAAADPGSSNAPASNATRMEIVRADFSKRSVGAYTMWMVAGDFGSSANSNNGLDERRATIAEEGGNKFLRVTFPSGKFGPKEAGVQFKVPFAKSYEELYFSYRVRFKAGFDFVKGGKLPGLVGGTSPTGCRPSKTGFSARNMWRTGGAIVQYLYWPNQTTPCGEDLHYMDGASQKLFVPGEWVTVEHRIKMNAPGIANGVLQTWVNGVLTLDEHARLWRDTGSSFGIDTLYFSTFFGGSNASWAPATEQVVDFDDLVVADKPISF